MFTSLSGITSHPGIGQLFPPPESIVGKSPEEILLRWVNFQLEKVRIWTTIFLYFWSQGRPMPPIYLLLIFAILQFEISSLMNLIFSLFQTWILQTTAGGKIQFKLEKIQFIKLNISNWRIAKLMCRFDRGVEKIENQAGTFEQKFLIVPIRQFHESYLFHRGFREMFWLFLIKINGYFDGFF